MRGLLKMRVKHIPAVFLLANTIAAVVIGTETAMFLSWFAFLTSWTYLRFYRKSPLMDSSATGDSETLRGDASDTFAFAYFFPEPVHGLISQVADKIYAILVTLRLCTPFSVEDIDIGNEQANARAEGGLPTTRGGVRREEAERRRALALKALDQRLQHSNTRGTPSATPGPSVLTVPAPEMNAEPEDEPAGSGSHS
jgi:hypothetical protein